ncbi:MAG: hypothetical protein MZU97_03600 [Bacillus subtilis]|nr:hypothetical protein [Bacillus subtilis]
MKKIMILGIGCLVLMATLGCEATITSTSTSPRIPHHLILTETTTSTATTTSTIPTTVTTTCAIGDVVVDGQCVDTPIFCRARTHLHWSALINTAVASKGVIDIAYQDASTIAYLYGGIFFVHKEGVPFQSYDLTKFITTLYMNAYPVVVGYHPETNSMFLTLFNSIYRVSID